MSFEHVFVEIKGLSNDQVASHALWSNECPECKKQQGEPCLSNGRVCRERYTAAIKDLASAATDVVKGKLTLAEEWKANAS